MQYVQTNRQFELSSQTVEQNMMLLDDENKYTIYIYDLHSQSLPYHYFTWLKSPNNALKLMLHVWILHIICNSKNGVLKSNFLEMIDSILRTAV